MKKISLALALFAAISVSSTKVSADIIITKNNGGPKGWLDIKVNHDDKGDYLNCKDPGESDCKFPSSVISPNRIKSTATNITYRVKEDIESVVETYINNNSTTGQYLLEPGILVTWNGTDTKNYTLSISGDFTNA